MWSQFLEMIVRMLGSSPDGSQAHAYIDPGTGSFVLQLLLAAVLGGFFALKTQWRRLTAWLRRSSEKK